MITSKDQPTQYKLKFLPEALKEWHQLDGSIKVIFRKSLKKRLVQPKVPGSELHGDLKDCYKIKLLKHGYRLVYTIEDNELVVLVLAVDKREKSIAYQSALFRLLSH
ncbi:MAG: type II toxin-antitoxin system RelE/ParE family toxin [Betaproteobacteria bacterium]|nr:type II toxin-antitoxin system RelE/ParE family toxin [Betaproteobacteria bacterium]